MRTTVDLPEAVHQKALALATERRQSLSSIVAELTTRGLASLGEPMTISVDPTNGMPSISIGRPITSAMVADLLDDE